MKPLSRLVYRQLRLIKPLLNSRNVLFYSRKAQDYFGTFGAVANADSVRFEYTEVGSNPCAMAIPLTLSEKNHSKVILYVHGGGYTAGGLEYCKGFGSLLAHVTGCRVFCVSYRLAPENPFPCALDDVTAAYRHLCRNVTEPRNIIVAGESAGGGLEFSLMLKLKEQGESLPAGIVAISPWTDLTNSGESYITNAKTDATLSKKLLDYYADCYAADASKDDPLISPLFGDLHGLPKTLIIAGGSEVLLSDSQLMAKALARHGVDVTFTQYPGMWHVFVLFKTYEAREALKQITNFIEEC